MAPLCISGLGWLGMSLSLFTHPVWDGCIKAIGPRCLPLPVWAACFDAPPPLRGLTPPPFASTRLMGYGYVSATSRLPPYLWLVGPIAYALPLCPCVESDHRSLVYYSCLAPSCSSHGLDVAGSVICHLRAMPTTNPNIN